VNVADLPHQLEKALLGRHPVAGSLLGVAPLALCGAAATAQELVVVILRVRPAPLPQTAAVQTDK